MFQNDTDVNALFIGYDDNWKGCSCSGNPVANTLQTTSSEECRKFSFLNLVYLTILAFVGINRGRYQLKETFTYIT